MSNELISIGGYSFKGLLYDAQQGVVLSRLTIYEAFCGMVRRGKMPPREMLKFIGNEIYLVLEEKQKPAQIFNKAGKKLPTLSPHYWQLVEIHRPTVDGDIHAAFEYVSELLGNNPSPSQIKKHYFDYQKRIGRIKRVNDLIIELEDIKTINSRDWTAEQARRRMEIPQELKKIYKNPKGLL